jgi:GT2 family glycosyltransferase
MKNITIILPVHSVNDEYELMLKNALGSVEDFHNDVKVSIVCPKSIKKDVDKSLKNFENKLDIVVIENKGDTGFCGQVNLGIEKCDTEWFSILEIDDEFRPFWLKYMNEYMKTYSDVDIFLPIVKDVNVEGEFLSFTNESAWAYGFTEKQGFIDNDVLLEFQNYQTSGGLFKTDVVKENGSFKENIKLTFTYEFLLRLTHNGAKIMIVPRLGYQHVNFRENSIFWSYKNDDKNKLSESEVKFWLDTAKKEFFFKNKREVNYVES